MSMSIEQIRKEWFYEAKKRVLLTNDLISRKAVHDNIGELELFAYLTDDDIREYGLSVDENGEFYFTEEQGRIASVMYVLMRRYIEGFPAAMIDRANALHVTRNNPHNISDERAMTLFWWWSIEKNFGFPKLEWRNNLTPEEQVLVRRWDADITEEVEKGN